MRAEWDPLWNKLARLRDAKGQETEFTYVSAGGGAGEMETYYTYNPKAQTISAMAYWTGSDGKADQSKPGEFRVFNGSAKDFGITVPAGQTIAGFRENLKTGEVSVVFRSKESVTGSRIPVYKYEEHKLKK